MARQPRYLLPGYPQHVIQRGNNHDVIFASENDCRFYLEKLSDRCRRYGCRIHAYVLMTNHVHLLITPDTERSISRTMQSLGCCYVRYFNTAYGRTGTLWEGRFRATLVDTDQYLLACYRYIEENPVRAGMVASPANYRWSSHHCNAAGTPDKLVSPHDGYRALGASDAARQRAYVGMFDAALPEETVCRIRDATNKAWVLGDDSFRARVEALVKRQMSPCVRGGDRKSDGFRDRRKINRV